jgi:site-specific DNA-methyltransferase (adenine-specific)
MSNQASFVLRNRNPDVLTCIANLSNDEVFTPPDLANQMLDQLEMAWSKDNSGESIWSNKNVKFLDPCTKSGVFLREITTRLTKGLTEHFPDLNERVDHILTKQVYGIAITKLTSLLARRSVYCSKHAVGQNSIAKSFKEDSGNIWYSRIEHQWEDTKCKFCGAPRSIFERNVDAENYAYGFIHADNSEENVEKLFGEKMQFDVIIGNPPYQMKGGAGGTSDSSIYQLFVQQAINLNPKYLSMVIPARWMAGGRGLDEFRTQMLGDGNIRYLTDYPDSSEAFPGVQIKGGICYFLWDGEHKGSCTVNRVANGKSHTQNNRNIGEFDVFVRDERGLSILHKVLQKKEASVTEMVSGDTPFGIATNFEDWTERSASDKIPLHLINKGKRTIGYIKRAEIRKNVHLVDQWKVLVPKAYGAGESFPHQILGKEILASAPSVCTQTYLVVSGFSSESEAISFSSYYKSRFFRFLVSLRKITQDALKSTYTWVPQQKWDRAWTDELLYKKYGINSEEIEFIDSMIRPMGDADE